jgi:3-methyl-2-oxobutanoate hydroxymethyltransferase
MKSIIDFQKSRDSSRKISVVTCYDFWSAKIINDSDIDAVLVGDSASMVMHGFESTTGADLDMMASHVLAVSRGLKDKLLIADMPFLAHRKGLNELMDGVDNLIKAGAQAVKIEGAGDNTNLIRHVVDSGVPVMGHIGLTPQSIHRFGGFKVQGKDHKGANGLLVAARELEQAGCFSIVLELVPAEVGREITEKISIPTIGIGAGKYTSGQVLVLQDLLGVDNEFNPKFLRKYLNGFELIKDALNNYNDDVKKEQFPSGEESY